MQKAFSLQRNDLTLHVPVRTGNTFSIAMLAVNLERCGEEKDLTNQNLITILTEYILSWYTRTWMITKSLETWWSFCCVAFFSFQSSKLETLWLLDSTSIFRHSATYNSDHCSKIVFIVFTLTWKTRAVKKHFLYPTVSIVLFWCMEKPPTLISNLKDVTRRLLQDEWGFQSLKKLLHNVDAVSVHLHKLLSERQLPSCVKTMSQLENACVLTCWKMLCQKLQMLLVVEKFSRQLQRALEDKLWENNCVMVAEKKFHAELFQQSLQN